MHLIETSFLYYSNFWLQYSCHPVLELGCGKGRHRGLFTSTIARGAPRRLSTRNATTVAATAKASRWGAGGRRPNPYTTTGWWWGGSPVGSGSSGISIGGVRPADRTHSPYLATNRPYQYPTCAPEQHQPCAPGQYLTVQSSSDTSQPSVTGGKWGRSGEDREPPQWGNS